MSKKIYLSLLIIVAIVSVAGLLIGSQNSNNQINDLFYGSEGFDKENQNEEGNDQFENNINLETNKDMIATIQTNFGPIELEFFSDKAPKTVENFLKLAEAGFYDGTKFHRVISGFMIQGGDPLTKDDSQKSSWGTGGPGYTFADEIYNGNSNEFGTISMANAGPNTNGSQFFINTADNNFLDTKHTVFGKVINGIEIVRQIENIDTEASDRPAQDVVITTIAVKEN